VGGLNNEEMTTITGRDDDSTEEDKIFISIN